MYGAGHSARGYEGTVMGKALPLPSGGLCSNKGVKI